MPLRYLRRAMDAAAYSRTYVVDRSSRRSVTQKRKIEVELLYPAAQRQVLAVLAQVLRPLVVRIKVD